MTGQEFENHLVFDKLEQFKNRLAEDEIRESIGIDGLNFYETAYNYLIDRLKLTLPTIVQESELSTISQELENSLSQINTFVGNKNTEHLTNTKTKSSSPPKLIISAKDKDEHYVLDICDKVLGLNSSRQHKFDILLGDLGKNGKPRKLPVDSYYNKLNLVIEYCEKQHTESVAYFDKPNKMTISGVHRGDQRKIYDERRKLVLHQNDIKLIELSYSDFNHNRQKLIIRNIKHDTEIVKQKLMDFVK